MEESFGWVGKLLWIDLTEGKMEERETLEYVPSFLGGRGIASKIAWDEIPPGVGALDPENPLMFLTGPLTGTTAPFSGRTSICGLAPQGYPHEWFARSNMGGHWGAELKYAGYDGLIIRGKAEKPIYLWVHDGEAEIQEAASLWGLGTYQAQERLMERLGKDARVVAIGQAGENLSRVAVINYGTESAAGQGGFGAVMGSKKLKAIAVTGRRGIRIAKPQRFLDQCNAIMAQTRNAPFSLPRQPKLSPERAAKYGQKFQSCSQQCTARCTSYYRRVPGRVHRERMYSGQMHCVSPLFPGAEGTFYDWKLGFEAGFEVSTFANDYGLNHWDIVFGLIPWLRACKEARLISDIDGIPIDLNNPEFWLELLRKMAYREGLGDVLAEGGRRAAESLGQGKEFMEALYPAWGFAGHWDGHGDHDNHIIFPFWLVSALQWAMDTRDPFSSGHGYAENIMVWSPILAPEYGLSWEEIAAVGQMVYGSPLAANVKSSYEDKAIPAVWHGDRSVLIDSIPVCDWIFPCIFSKNTEDHLARANQMKGPDFEYHLFVSATGMELSKKEFYRACERIFNLERAVQIRNYGRSRQDDETVIPYFEREENWQNPFLERRERLDREKFRKLMDKYYELRGWDIASGRPKRAKLEELGLDYVADDLENRGLLPH